METLSKVADFVKENIPQAEILWVNHQEKIFSDNACTPIKEGIVILITSSPSANH